MPNEERQTPFLFSHSNIQNNRIINKMNHLAHCFLARQQNDWIVGNMVADYARGRVDALPYSAAIRTGIAMHRHIDSFTDNHAVVRAAYAVLHPTQHKYAPIVIDVCFDYFLAKHWHNYSPETPLPEFSRRVCAALQTHVADLPAPLRERLPRMTAHNFLTTYADRRGMDYAFANLARRSQFTTNFLQATDEVLQHETVLEQHFLQFFPDLQTSVAAFNVAV
jgi:acyl carrier protein phosphodiesterase